MTRVKCFPMLYRSGGLFRPFIHVNPCWELCSIEKCVLRSCNQTSSYYLVAVLSRGQSEALFLRVSLINVPYRVGPWILFVPTLRIVHIGCSVKVGMHKTLSHDQCFVIFFVIIKLPRWLGIMQDLQAVTQHLILAFSAFQMKSEIHRWKLNWKETGIPSLIESTPTCSCIPNQLGTITLVVCFSTTCHGRLSWSQLIEPA